jgi:hypothetical protein
MPICNNCNAKRLHPFFFTKQKNCAKNPPTTSAAFKGESSRSNFFKIWCYLRFFIRMVLPKLTHITEAAPLSNSSCSSISKVLPVVEISSTSRMCLPAIRVLSMRKLLISSSVLRLLVRQKLAVEYFLLMAMVASLTMRLFFAMALATFVMEFILV